MAEPSSSGISITALLIALLGPLAGQYTAIVMGALAGALWPLSTMELPSKLAGAAFLLRIVSSAVLLTGSVAWYLETTFQIPAIHGMAFVAFLIGAVGNGWLRVIKIIRNRIFALAGQQSDAGRGK